VTDDDKNERSQFPSAAELDAAGWVRKSRRERQIQSRPRVGQYYWVDFPHDAYAPEFEGEHPAIVVRAAKNLFDTCIVVPITSQPQERDTHVHIFKRNPNPVGHAQGKVAHAICDHIYTVHVHRLRPVLTAKGQPIFSKIDPDDLEAIHAKMLNALQLPVPQIVVADQNAFEPRPRGPNTLSLKGTKQDGD
jgi:uncharacterized protein YifN (PemK superfamily)